MVIDGDEIPRFGRFAHNFFYQLIITTQHACFYVEICKSKYDMYGTRQGNLHFFADHFGVP